MAKRKVKFEFGSNEEEKIEKAYRNTGTGKVFYELAVVSFVALFVGFLIKLYEYVSALNKVEINYSNPIYLYSEYLIVWGGLVALICLAFYMGFAKKYKNKKIAAKTSAKKATKKKKSKK